MSARIPLMHYNMFSDRLEKVASRFAQRVNTSKNFTNCESLKKEINTLSLEIRYLVHLLENLTKEIKNAESTPVKDQLGSHQHINVEKERLA